MNSKDKILVTISAANQAPMMFPIPVGAERDSREKTIFHMSSQDGVVNILGTYDEILDFASGIMAKMFSWPLMTGHSDWFNDVDHDMIGRMAGDDSNGQAYGGGSEDRDGASGEREGFPGPSAA